MGFRQPWRPRLAINAWLEWLKESTNDKGSAMGRWYLGQLANGNGLEDAARNNLQARILEMIETLDDVRASADYQIFQAAEEDAAVIGRIVAAQQEGLEKEIAALQAEAARTAEEAKELAGEVPF